MKILKKQGKITFRTKGQARYVYYEYSREYDPSKQYTNVKRITIGKVLPEDENKMRPNENFRKYFPEVEQPEEKTVSCRSSCLKTGAYMIIDKAAKDLELDTKLQDSFGAKAAGIMLDMAAYSIITEGNADRCKRERIYISYDSTNKNCHAGDIDIVEFGAAKVDAGLPIFNYAVGYDVNNREPLMYEKYSGSINDVSQLQFMVDKIKGYGYKNIGFILDRGYFSKDNLSYMDNSGFSFIIMVKGIKDFISSQVRKLKGTFENNWGNQIEEFEVYGKTVHTFVYASDTKKRYIHIYYSAAKAVGERAGLEEKIHEMKRFMEQHENKEYEFGPAFHKYFHMHYNKENGHFVYGEPRLPVIRDELELCGYFAIISSEKMDAKDAINLYKSRDVSEKVFRADKSYLGNHCLRVASEEAASNKIFIGFLALIIRCRIYTALKEKAKELTNKPNYLTVPAAIRELEKIEMTRQLDKVYRLDHAVTKTQKVILSAFGMDWNHVKYRAENISEILKGVQ